MILATFKWDYLLIAIVLGLLVGLIITKRGKVDKSKMQKLSLDEFLKTMRKGSLIDIRKKKAVEEKGKIVGARNFPGASGTRVSSVRKDLPVFIYDEKGKRSKAIAAKYVNSGYIMVYYLSGGYKEYVEAKEKELESPISK